MSDNEEEDIDDELSQALLRIEELEFQLANTEEKLGLAEMECEHLRIENSDIESEGMRRIQELTWQLENTSSGGHW